MGGTYSTTINWMFLNYMKCVDRSLTKTNHSNMTSLLLHICIINIYFFVLLIMFYNCPRIRTRTIHAYVWHDNHYVINNQLHLQCSYFFKKYKLSYKYINTLTKYRNKPVHDASLIFKTHFVFFICGI